ncbi:spermidine/putrescine ABC transporter ATP-binding protein [Spiroplasma sabaudiense Ar-1343]|uniref:Spermidine/putrescine ABC transporter ATP-binding protein n=1 Tax=Spiroplasma sabaudiense Ar-1343 TaxID=1276257 RepID=W6A8P1_9MOLU|nr:spermidine/putrescine ABC transporter ATP-binding protein [Spiroplasma sabaudiense]AHI53533.1 spermidine/putrescine ABC transporter ATP-binding protein [Spiroplasma sabaudiense Ar-1343]
MEKNSILQIRNITKDYDGKVVLKGISLNIHEGEFITLLGPSGCGKTTTLNIIGGFEKPNSGEILFENKNLLALPINKRQMNTIFQGYALFPHLDVFDNVAYGLRNKKTKPDIIEKEVMQHLKQVGLLGNENKRVGELSGGQKQRVAIARALVMKPKILLLDEPMSALDVHLKKIMQKELKRLQEEVGITFILVTHDQEEALTLSDRVVVMNQGMIQQVGTPEDIYNEPENKWVAKFIGISNIIEDGIFIRDGKVKIDGQEFSCQDKGFGENDENIDIVIRPEDVDIQTAGKGFFQGIIKNVIFKGVYYEAIVETEFREWLIHTTDLVEEGANVGIRWNVEDIHVMWKEIDN